VILLLAACDGGRGAPGDRADDTGGAAPIGPPGPLAAMSAWVDADPATDPFAAERPEAAACPLGGTQLEGSTFEVDTGVCTWLWVEQPLPVAVAVGDPLELVFWHSLLLSDPPADAHLAVVIDGELVHEVVIGVPGDPYAYTEAFAAPIAAPAGAPIALHLHNHGANTWNVLRIDRVAPE
jgi:hypothetical protein